MVGCEYIQQGKAKLKGSLDGKERLAASKGSRLACTVQETACNPVNLKKTEKTKK
jgi:hypothetical protein